MTCVPAAEAAPRVCPEPLPPQCSLSAEAGPLCPHGLRQAPPPQPGAFSGHPADTGVQTPVTLSRGSGASVGTGRCLLPVSQ